MLWSIIGLLILIWLVAVVLKATAGGLIHLLLIAAVIVLVVNLLRGRKAPL